jgi:predicted RNase H-like HicB family nuclease
MFIPMEVINFPVILQSDETGGFIVDCPILEGCYSQGDTVDEALANIREAIELCIEDLEERGETVPDSTRILTSTISIVK